MTNTQIIQKLYENFGNKDIPAILDMLTDDVIFEDYSGLWNGSTHQVVPFHGKYEGKEGMVKFFTKMAETTDITSFEPQDFCVNGDRVIALVNLGGSYKQSGISGKDLWVKIWDLENGKVKRLRATSFPGTI